LEGKALDTVVKYTQSAEVIQTVQTLTKLMAMVCAAHVTTLRRDILVIAALAGVSDACENALGRSDILIDTPFSVF